ncbi:hypothetical protein [Gracilibacillus sp. YIM 98692]|uniref:hypothetical protein n=1 Tax=Gracilibacillus sp. YIM 98692 TaxID=2663532 RepID=UPI0013D0A5ED|nr:hypothetical protein [Gracilibacillus sp. YIM 98692]
MSDVLIMGAFGIAIYIFARVMEKKPILPWKEPNPDKLAKQNVKGKSKKQNKHLIQPDEEPKTFREFLSEVKEIDNHMLRYKDNRFVLIAEVDPVNYFLLSDHEQNAIDADFENWLAQIDYHVQFYLQNRYIDLTEPIQEMQKNMEIAEDLSKNALEYGQSMVNDLVRWQQEQPRFETKRYIVWTHQVKASDITAENTEELEQKIVEKAFAELFRRYNTAKQQLRKARMKVDLLTSEGLGELLYYTFNRRKAVKNRFRDMVDQEMTSLYVTADQEDAFIELVKEGIENEAMGEDKKLQEAAAEENKENKNTEERAS